MKTKNAMILRSEQARFFLMKWTGMDELDYQLAILEGGCTYLEQITAPTAVISEELMREYRAHLTAMGFWSFYEYIFRLLEIAVLEEWSRPDALELLQPQPWIRARWLEHIKGMPWMKCASDEMDIWLKNAQPARPRKAKTSTNLIPH